MKVIIGSDHAGYELKEWLKENKPEIVWDDKGCYSSDSVDYPDFAHAVADAVASDDSMGVLICGSANGVAMSANKNKTIRAAIAWTPEISALARQHNNANILCIPARFVGMEVALEIFEKFFNTDFEGGRHQGRVDKI